MTRVSNVFDRRVRRSWPSVKIDAADNLGGSNSQITKNLIVSESNINEKNSKSSFLIEKIFKKE